MHKITKADISLPSHSFRIDTPLIVSWHTVLTGQNDEPDSTDERNQTYEHPPAAFSDVMHPADSDCNAGNQNSERIDVRNGRNADQSAYKSQNSSDDNIDEIKHPVLRSSCPAAEISILLQAFDVPIHNEKI